MHAACKYRCQTYAYVCMRLSLTTGRGTATALHGGKGEETSLPSIKMQQRADMAQFCNGSDLSYHTCGSTEIGWTLFGLASVLA